MPTQTIHAFCFLLLLSTSACTVSPNYAFPDRDSNKTTGTALPEPSKGLVASDGSRKTLQEFQGKALILVVTRGFAGYICPYCTTYTAQLIRQKDQIEKLGAQIAIIYPTKDKDPKKVDEFIKACKTVLEEDGPQALGVPVFLDPGLQLVKQYQLEGDLSRPSSFILDKDGIVRYAYVGESKKDRPSIKRLIEELQKLQPQ